MAYLEPKKPRSKDKIYVPTWKCEDGRIIKVCDMEDKHLTNAIAHCRRNKNERLIILLKERLRRDSMAFEDRSSWPYIDDLRSDFEEEFKEKETFMDMLEQI